MNRATEDLMDMLHGTIAQSLLDEIQGYKDRKEPVPAAVIGQAIKFLKDNGIDRAVRPGDSEDLLAKELEDYETPDNVLPMQRKQQQ